MIAIDLMSGDVDYTHRMAAVLIALKKNSDLKLILVGQDVAITYCQEALPSQYKDRVLFHQAEQVVQMHEQPASALRGKRQSSIHEALGLVKSGDALACVSAGNTGALAAIAHYKLKMIPGVMRPALLSFFPTMKTDKTSYNVCGVIRCDIF